MEILIVILICVIVFLLFGKATNNDSLGELDRLRRENEKLELQVSVYSKNVQEYAKTIPEEVHLRALQEKKIVIECLNKEVSTLQAAGAEIAEKLRQEQSRTKSEQVRMGLLSENLIPFLGDFPYERKSLHALFRPIDFLFFGEEEIVFLELKSGNSQLSAKQKKIKEIVEKKNVRFEVWQFNEEGVKKK